MPNFWCEDVECKAINDLIEADDHVSAVREFINRNYEPADGDRLHISARIYPNYKNEYFRVVCQIPKPIYYISNAFSDLD